MRPTGKLHLGHLVGALENWVALQREFQNYHLIADYHALTTNPDSSDIYKNSIDMLIDWLAAGIDPTISPVFRQSQIKEHTELHLIFSMLITTARLERNPTVKEQVRDLNIENVIYGHLGYPVLQAADILLYKGDVVPVGEDQVPHVEITREIARKFNDQYGNVFPEPEAKLTKFARLPGLDGSMKMSKSAGNTILLSDSPDEIKARMKKAVTDPLKIRKGDPGRPEICLVYTYHQKFNPTEVPEIAAGCRSGALGCVDCKLNCANHIIEVLAPIREKRAYYESHPKEVTDILLDGEARAKKVAQATMTEVREAMKLG
ncbi:MAG: tryptophan--tRNA ligase [Ignavibacteriae bacterium]|nr:tryptophan--tRNA ligase [Ignavibacteria bacterium]MBI3365453.1 tryptophan--tRNA ligase [Ignavibacteriota bacterium]